MTYLLRYLESLLFKKLIIRGHCEVSHKECPVFDYTAVLNLKDKKLPDIDYKKLLNIKIEFRTQFSRDKITSLIKEIYK